MPIPLDTRAGAAIYTSLTLSFYDWWVLGLSNQYAWQCPTRAVLLPFYREHLGRCHLDVGVGSGFYLERAGFTSKQQLTLLDLNINSLRVAARRVPDLDFFSFQADVMQPLTVLRGQKYDSISLFYLLHCLPGSMTDKAQIFSHLKPHLRMNGALYGATILGDAVCHNAFGRRLMRLYNRKGIFSNYADTHESLEDALNGHFSSVKINRHGKVALFVARHPI